jgi:hypothetical protein
MSSAPTVSECAEPGHLADDRFRVWAISDETTPMATKGLSRSSPSRPHRISAIAREQKSTAAPASSPTTSAAPSSNLTESQQNAVQAAQSYLEMSGFSRRGLINQLSSSAGDGYSLHDATVAVDSLQVNWDAQAVRSAKDYLQQSSFSCQGLIQQLDSSPGDQYTEAQAQYAATKVGLC